MTIDDILDMAKNADFYCMLRSASNADDITDFVCEIFKHVEGFDKELLQVAVINDPYFKDERSKPFNVLYDGDKINSVVYVCLMEGQLENCAVTTARSKRERSCLVKDTPMGRGWMANALVEKKYSVELKIQRV